MLAIAAFVCLYGLAAAVLVEEVWISATVEEAQLSSLRSETFYSATLLHCLSLGTRLEWSYVACYSEVEEQCTLWEMDAFGFGDVVKDDTLGRSRCKTLKRNYGGLG